MSKNTVHIPNEDDNLSVKSGGSAESSKSSVSQLKHQCPHCPKELKTTNLFRHIRLQHTEEFSDYMVTRDPIKLEEQYNLCQPFPMEWSTTNDFDETEEHKFFGCLCCNNTFTNKPRAQSHVKNKKCKAKHLSELKGIIKQEKANAKTRKNKPKPKPWPVLLNDLELEMRRYKYLLKVSHELNLILDEMIDTGRAEIAEAKKKVPLLMFDNSDYVLPANLNKNIELYELLIRTWGNLTRLTEDKFCKLRGDLYYYSFAKVDRFFTQSDNHEKGQFIGSSYHDALGPTDYPLLTEPDVSLIQSLPITDGGP
jgi:hypothetical protein